MLPFCGCVWVLLFFFSFFFGCTMTHLALSFLSSFLFDVSWNTELFLMLQEKVSLWKLLISPLAKRADIDGMINVMWIAHDDSFLKTVTSILVCETTCLRTFTTFKLFTLAYVPKKPITPLSKNSAVQYKDFYLSLVLGSSYSQFKDFFHYFHCLNRIIY